MHPGGLLLGGPEELGVLPSQFINVKFLGVKHPVEAIDFVLGIVNQLVVLIYEFKQGPTGVLHVVIGVACDLFCAKCGLETTSGHLHHSFHCVCLDLG